MKRFILILLFSITTFAQEESPASSVSLLNIILALSIPITTLIATLIAQHYSNRRHAILQEIELFKDWKEKYINAVSGFQAGIINIFQVEDTFKREEEETYKLIEEYENESDSKTNFEMVSKQYLKARKKGDRLLKIHLEHAVNAKILLNYIPLEYRKQFLEKEDKLTDKIKVLVKSKSPTEHSQKFKELEDALDELLSSILDQKENKIRERFEKYL